MADFLEGTTIGGSIAITEKNIYDYLDDIISDTSIDRLAPKTNSFEEYIEAFNITDMNTLSPSRDIGLYITTGVSTPDANIYGTYEIPGNLKTSTWTNTQSKLDVAKYNLTKSPMADKSLLFIFNNDFDPTINKLTLMCYHIDSGVWYRMNQIKGTDKLSKKWEVDLQVQLHYDNMRKLSNVIDDLFSDKMDKSKNLSDLVNVTEARRNLNIALTDVVGTGLSTLYSSQKLSKVIDDKVNANVIVTNETKANLTKTDGKLADTITDLNNYKVSNDENILDTKTTLQTNINTKITGGIIVGVSGSSIVDVPHQKFVTDEFKKVNDNLNTVIDTTVVDLQEKIDTKITGGSVVQATGPSTVNVPSQKLVTDEFKKVNDTLNTVVDQTVVDLQQKIDTKLTAGTLVQVEGTSTTNVMSQKGVTDGLSLLRSNKMDKAQNLKDLANVTTARTNLGLGTSAIRDLTSVQGTSTALVASQKLVADVKTEINDYNNTELAKKWDIQDTTGTGDVARMSEVQVKADTLYVNTELDKKWDIQTTTGTGNIARMSEVDNKADTAYVDMELGKKRDLTNSIFSDHVTINAGDYAGVYLRSSSKPDVILERTGSGALTFVRRENSTGGSNLNVISLPLNNKSGTIALTSDIVNDGTKLGAEQRINWSRWMVVPNGCVMTGMAINGGDGYTEYILYRPIIRL